MFPFQISAFATGAITYRVSEWKRNDIGRNIIAFRYVTRNF